jgi:Cu/Ag efflux pump CusA
MIHHIVALCLKFRVLLLGVAVLVAAQGVLQLRDARVAVLPEFMPPQVQIQTEALGLSAAEVEQLITIPIEHDLLNGVAWLDQIQSESAPGLSSIDLTFKPGTDILKARQAVQERLTQAHALPAVGTPPVMIQPLSSESRVMMIGLSGKDLSSIDLSVLARWKIKPRLMGVPGVANVSIWGQRDRQLQVQVDPQRLRQNGMTLNQVITTTGNSLWVSPLTFVEASTPGTGGFIDTSSQRLAIQHILPITTAQGLASVSIEDTVNGKTLRLGQVANVVEDHQPLIGDAILTGGPGLMLVIQKFPEANSREVTAGVMEALDALRPGLTGVGIDTSVYQSETYIQAALRNLGKWGLAGSVLLVVLLGLVLISWRLALITLVAIFLSLIAATYVLHLLGATLNLAVLAGLAVALGVLVDDAVVDLDRIRRRLAVGEGSPKPSVAEVIAAAASDMRGPLAYATLIVLLIPLPLVFLDGVVGAFTRPAVLAYGAAVLSSSVVALTISPVLAFLLLRNRSGGIRESPVVRFAQGWLAKSVPWYLLRPRWAYGTVAILVVALGCAAVPQLDSKPAALPLQDRTLMVHWSTIPGTSLSEMERITTSATKELRGLPGVGHVGAHIGRALMSDQVVDVNAGELWLNVNETADYNATVASVRSLLKGYPGLRSEVLTYPQDRLEQAAKSAADTAFTVRVYGLDLATMRVKAEEIRARIASVPGVVAPKVHVQPEAPTLVVQVNLAAAQKYGLNPGDVRRAATTFFSGLLVGNLYEQQKVFEVVVQGSPTTRTSPAAMSDLLIDAPGGNQVRLGDIANVSVVPSQTVIKHDATLRSIDVTANVAGRDLGSVLNDVNKTVRTVVMPLEYHVEVLSNRQVDQNKGLRMIALAVAAALGIFLLLQAAFGSWRLAAAVLVMLPMAATGGLFASLFVGGVATIGAPIGLLAVMALTVRNCVLLIRDSRAMEDALGIQPGSESIVVAARLHIRPALLTAGATAAVFAPLLVLGGNAGTEFLFPMAAVVLGGLVSSTIVTLFVLPAVYLRLAPAGAVAAKGGIG